MKANPFHVLMILLFLLVVIAVVVIYLEMGDPIPLP